MRWFKIRVVVCDSEALRRNRCLGMLGCGCLKLGLCAIAFGDVGMRSFKIGVVCDRHLGIS
ncbi:hypothetical protein IQ226_04375 [Dolichospermum sp. LEGE 00240]|uniref:hypothetical protein n=1 Tax=Dolichospermum sp. LEGE 00240 TaxID=1828603 RepID=UPI00188004D5|nr:hypothetical protein [Dolichospermum sp. LEGE 00240]MBE9248439.1 hypothetical protein [Dolichospermum sp. LEGE 00240]MDM3851913.1 hypothetical protein [Aphanizomenon gracile PMC627.10]MDM3857696.1 hypothetical protein [Aphanizomenon gracile PMC649.10]